MKEPGRKVRNNIHYCRLLGNNIQFCRPVISPRRRELWRYLLVLSFHSLQLPFQFFGLLRVWIYFNPRNTQMEIGNFIYLALRLNAPNSFIFPSMLYIKSKNAYLHGVKYFRISVPHKSQPVVPTILIKPSSVLLYAIGTREGHRDTKRRRKV